MFRLSHPGGTFVFCLFSISSMKALNQKKKTTNSGSGAWNPGGIGSPLNIYLFDILENPSWWSWKTSWGRRFCHPPWEKNWKGNAFNPVRKHRMLELGSKSSFTKILPPKKHRNTMQYISAVSKVRGVSFLSQPCFSGFDTISRQKCGDHPLRGGTYHHQMTTSPWVQSSWKRSKSCGLSSLHSWQIFHVLPCHAGKLWLVKSCKPSKHAGKACKSGGWKIVKHIWNHQLV